VETWLKTTAEEEFIPKKFTSRLIYRNNAVENASIQARNSNKVKPQLQHFDLA